MLILLYAHKLILLCSKENVDTVWSSYYLASVQTSDISCERLSFKFLADTIYINVPLSIVHQVPLSIVHQVTGIFFEKEEVKQWWCSLNDRHFIFFVIVIFAPKCEKPQLDYTQRKDRLNKILTAANFHPC